MLKGNVEKSVRRLEEMKQATILRFLNNINLEKEYYLYDEMVVRFAQGELDDYFVSEVLEDLAEEDKEEVYNLGIKYRSLCFYAGEGEYWTDSVEGVPMDDYELITLKIFDNYDFLLEIARDGGKDVLEQIKKFQNCVGYYEGSVIEVLRNSFGDDQLLKTLLLEMSREESLYDIFTDVQKAQLCREPEGTLFTYEEKEANLRNPLDLALALKDYYRKDDGSTEREYRTDVLFSEIKKEFKRIPVELVVSEISDDYVREHGHYVKNEESNQKGKGMR